MTKEKEKFNETSQVCFRSRRREKRKRTDKEKEEEEMRSV